MDSITEIKENGLLTARYFYDTLSRLIREDNKKLNKTYLISYTPKQPNVYDLLCRQGVSA